MLYYGLKISALWLISPDPDICKFPGCKFPGLLIKIIMDIYSKVKYNLATNLAFVLLSLSIFLTAFHVFAYAVNHSLFSYDLKPNIFQMSQRAGGVVLTAN